MRTYTPMRAGRCVVRLEVLSAGTSHVEDRSEDVGRGASISVDTEDEDGFVLQAIRTEAFFH